MPRGDSKRRMVDLIVAYGSATRRAEAASWLTLLPDEVKARREAADAAFAEILQAVYPRKKQQRAPAWKGKETAP